MDQHALRTMHKKAQGMQPLGQEFHSVVQTVVLHDAVMQDVDAGVSLSRRGCLWRTWRSLLPLQSGHPFRLWNHLGWHHSPA